MRRSITSAFILAWFTLYLLSAVHGTLGCIWNLRWIPAWRFPNTQFFTRWAPTVSRVSFHGLTPDNRWVVVDTAAYFPPVDPEISQWPHNAPPRAYPVMMRFVRRQEAARGHRYTRLRIVQHIRSLRPSTRAEDPRAADILVREETL